VKKLTLFLFLLLSPLSIGIAYETDPQNAKKVSPILWMLLQGAETPLATPECSEPSGSISFSDAAKFLTQATFGASEAAIDRLVAQNSLCQWIEQQMQLPASRTLPFVRANSNGSLRTTRHHVWWQNAMQGDDQLRQRVAFALSQIFVISDRDYELGNSQYGVSDYYDMLADNAFGSYQNLLEKVTLHPTMGVYLGMVRNQKANPSLFIRPDENYAREVLQLFSIGLHKLDQSGQTIPSSALDNSPINTYSQTTVENFARVFTGWNFVDSPGVWSTTTLTQYDKTRSMVADYNPALPNSFHDTGAKLLLDDQPLGASRGLVNPTQRDLYFALDNIVNHPNVPPFFSKLLIQRLTTSNPSPGYVRRVADVFVNNGRGQRGDLGQVVKAILLDPEARLGKSTNPNFGKVKEPILQVSQLWRAFNGSPGPDANGVYRLRASAASQVENIFGQAVMRSPSVFNFFLPDNPLSSANGAGLFSPEMQIMTEANIASIHNALYSQVYQYTNFDQDPFEVPVRINISKAVNLAGDPDALLDYLDKLLLAGEMSAPMRTIIRQHLTNLPVTGDVALDRAKDAIFIIAASPRYMLQD